MERESDQSIRDRQDQEQEQARIDRAKRLKHDIRTPQNPRDVPRESQNDFEALK